jgi:hypothetical protein
MAIDLPGFETRSDPKIAESVFLQSSDMWIRKSVFSGEGAWDITAGSPDTATFTPKVAPSPAWDADELIGGVIVIEGEEWEITDNDATSITVECEGSAVTDDDYTARIMSPYRFAGISEGKSFNLADETIKLTTGVPRKTLRKDLIERTLQMTGEVMISASEGGFGFFEVLLGLKRDDSATEYIGFGGTNPSPRDYFEVAFKAANVEGKDVQFRAFYGQFSSEGADIAMDEDGYKKIAFTYDAYADPLRDSGVEIQDENLFEVKVEI